MVTQDTYPIKERIMNILKNKGPSLPVRISKEINQNSLFTSAFLSELLSEKKIKISNLRVGNSPLYYVYETENLLENFSDHLKNKEKEAFMLLKEKKFLKDLDQEPAIRVALRSIKDFAKPLEKNNQLYWRYFNVSEEEFDSLGKKIPLEKEENTFEKISSEEKQESKRDNEIDIFDNKKEVKKENLNETKKTLVKKTTKKIAKKRASSKNTKNDKFFNRVKEFLNEKAIEIIDIESVGKNELIFKVRKNEEEKLLFAFNKKRISDADLIKANKKAAELNFKYIILSLGEPLKKLTNLIEAIKNLSLIERMD